MRSLALEVLTSVTASGIVSGLIGVCFKSRADQKLEQSKSLMRQLEEQTRTRFSRVYEARAKAMMEIYARSIEIGENVRTLVATHDMEASEYTLDRIHESINAVQAAIRQFNQSYRPCRLLFSPDISQALDDLSTLYATVPKTFYDNVDLEVQGEEFYGVEAVAKNLLQTDHLLRTLEAEFRKLYGSLDTR